MAIEKSYFRNNLFYVKFALIKKYRLWCKAYLVSIIDADVLVLYHPCLTQTKTKLLPCEFPF